VAGLHPPDSLQHFSVSSLIVLVFDNYFQSIVFQPDFHSFILCYFSKIVVNAACHRQSPKYAAQVS